jgi:hypothetical protein
MNRKKYLKLIRSRAVAVLYFAVAVYNYTLCHTVYIRAVSFPTHRKSTLNNDGNDNDSPLINNKLTM